VEQTFLFASPVAKSLNKADNAESHKPWYIKHKVRLFLSG